MNPVRRRFLVFALAVMAGMAGESLLLVRAQIGRCERILRDDFRVLLFLKSDPPESQVRVIEDRLMGLPEVMEVRFVSRDAALAALRREDPELVDSVAWMGENPLLPAFAVRPGRGGMGRFAEWLAAVRGVADWADLRYRPGQVRAILQTQLYGHFLSLVLSALLCAAAAALAVALWWAPSPGTASPCPPPLPGEENARPPGTTRPEASPLPGEENGALPHAVPTGLGDGLAGRGGRPPGTVAPWPSPSSKAATVTLAAAGAAVGMALALAAAWPARQYLPWWEIPRAAHQFVLWAAAALVAGLLYPCTEAD